MATDRLDGLHVDKYLARIAGTIDIDPSDSDRFSIDTTIVAVVVLRTRGVSFDEDKNGDLARVNKLSVSDFALVGEGELRNQLYLQLALKAPALTLDFPPHPVPNLTVAAVDSEIDRQRRRHIDETTGEVYIDPETQEEIFVPAQTSPPHGTPGKPDNALKRFLYEDD